MKLKIGIQGHRGSTNERACRFFAMKHGWDNFEIEYLIFTEEVLSALNGGNIDYGTFAWKSSRHGLVSETQEAIKKYPYKKIDEVTLQIDHALLSNSIINKDKLVRVFSHPQALEEHRSFLENEFLHVELIKEIDTAIAAEKLQKGEYPDNSVVIAPIACAETYGLDIFLLDLPTNKGYETTIYLVKK